MKPAKIKLDRQRLFIYNLRSLRKLEEALGEPLFSIFKGDINIEKFSFDFLTKVIWAGMLKEEELTLEEVEDIIPMDKLIPISTECITLLVGSISGTSGGSEGKKEKVATVS